MKTQKHKITSALLALVLVLTALMAMLTACNPIPEVDIMFLKTPPTVTSGYGENLAIADDGLLRVRYKDESTADVKVTLDMINLTGFNKNTTDKQTLSIKYGGKSVTFEFELLREAKTIAISAAPTVTSFLGRPFAIADDGVLAVTYRDGATENVTITLGMLDLTTIDLDSAAEQTITVKYGGLTTTFPVTLQEDPVDDTGEVKTFRFESEDANYGGGSVGVEDCGGDLASVPGTYLYRDEEQKIVDQTVKNLFLGEGGYIIWTITSSKTTHATIRIAIGEQCNNYPFDQYARLKVNGENIMTSLDPTVHEGTAAEIWGVAPWWTFRTYTVDVEITLRRGENQIGIFTYGYADIEVQDGDVSTQAGGRNITWIELVTTGELEQVPEPEL